MILVDTSVWIDHLRRSNASLTELLNSGQVLAHPFIIGEIALGNLKQRNVILDALQNLPLANMASDDEVFSYITKNKLFGIGIGYIDAHLLASIQLTPGSSLWTRDKRLSKAAKKLGLLTNLAH